MRYRSSCVQKRFAPIMSTRVVPNRRENRAAIPGSSHTSSTVSFGLVLRRMLTPSTNTHFQRWSSLFRQRSRHQCESGEALKRNRDLCELDGARLHQLGKPAPASSGHFRRRKFRRFFLRRRSGADRTVIRRPIGEDLAGVGV